MIKGRRKGDHQMAIDKDEIWRHAVRVWRLSSETLSRLKDKVDRDAWHSVYRSWQTAADVS